MKIEFMTHYQARDSKVHVYIKSIISHRKSRWMAFVQLVMGHSLKMVKYGRYQTPFDCMKGTSFNNELTSNRFTIDMNDSTPETPDVEPASVADPVAVKRKRSRTALTTRLFSSAIEEGGIVIQGKKNGLLERTMIRMFRGEWTRGHCEELKVLFRPKHIFNARAHVCPAGRGTAFWRCIAAC